MQKFKFDWSGTKQKMTEPTTNTNTSYKKDERIYSPEFSKQGTVNVLLRFLPPMRDDNGKLCDVDFPFVGPIYYHNMSENKKFMNVTCPTSIGKECPVCECNKENWDDYTGIQRKRSRKVNYYSNVLILKDHLHPENEGKVFIFRYGKKIYEKMMEKANPPADSLVSQADYWDYYQGTNFKLIIKKIKLESDSVAQNNYDSCCFEDSLSPIAKSDEEIDAIMKKCYPLKPYISESNFESYDVLKKKFEKFTMKTSSPSSKQSSAHSTPAQEETPVQEDVSSDALDVASPEDADDIFSKIKDED